MKTQKQLIAAHQKQMDAKFTREYPDGRFIIQVWEHCTSSKKLPDISKPNVEVSLAWEKKRRTSHVAPGGVCVKSYEGRKYVLPYLNCTWGFMRYFDSIDSMFEYADEIEIDEDQIAMFCKEYRARKSK